MPLPQHDEPDPAEVIPINMSCLKVGFINLCGWPLKKAAILEEDRGLWDVLIIAETWFCDDTWFAGEEKVVTISTPDEGDFGDGHTKGGLAVLIRPELQRFISNTTSSRRGVSVTLGNTCIAGVYLPPSMSLQDFKTELSNIPDCHILAGDFNTRWEGQLANNQKARERAQVLDHFLANRGLYMLSRDYNTPDHVASVKRGASLRLLSPTKLFPEGFRLPDDQRLTDHHWWLQAIIPIDGAWQADPALAPPHQQRAVRFRVHRLRSPAVSLLFEECLAQSLRSVLSEPTFRFSDPTVRDSVPVVQRQERLDAFYQRIVGAIHSSLEQTVGECGQSRIRHRRRAETDLHSLETEGESDPHSAFKQLRRHSAGFCIKSSAPELTHGVPMSPCACAVLHYRNIFTVSPQISHTLHESLALEQEQQAPPTPAAVDHCLQGFSRKLIAFAINEYPSGKSPGADGICCSVLKAVVPKSVNGEISSNHRLVSDLSTLFGLCIRWGLTPSEWGEATLKPIPKEDSPCLPIEQTRPISLTPMLRRIFEGLILCMMVQRDPSSPLSASESKRGKVLIGAMHPIQGGFRSGHSCPIHITSLHHNIITRNLLKIVFLDVQKAYDNTPVELALSRLKQRLPELGMPLLKVIRSLFTNTSFNAVVNGQLTSRVVRLRGLAQGSLLAPLLFNIFLDPLAYQLQPHPEQLHTGSPLSALIIADDIAIMDTDVNRIQQLVSVAVDWLKCNGLQVNAGKCAGIGFDAGSSIHLGSTRVDAGGSILKLVSCYKYLGIEFTAKGIDFAKLANRLGNKASQSLRECMRASRTYNWSPYVRLTMFKVVVRSRMEWGGGIFALWQQANDPDLKRKAFKRLNDITDQAVAWIFSRKVERLTSFQSELQAMRSVSGVPSLSERLRELGCFFCFHVEKSHPDNPIKAMMSQYLPCAPPWGYADLLPRLTTQTLWKAWVRWRDNEIREGELRAMEARRKGRPVPPPVKPNIVVFMDKTRQARLDHNGTFRLAARIRGKFARKKPGGYARSIRLKDQFLREAVLRWQGGVWGLGAACPACHGTFRTSHVAQCRLLDDLEEWTDYVTKASDLRARFVANNEVSANDIQGFGVIDAALCERQWRTAKRMLSDLAALLPEVTDWQGWGERRVMPAVPASSQDVDTDSDEDVGVDDAAD